MLWPIFQQIAIILWKFLRWIFLYLWCDYWLVWLQCLNVHFPVVDNIAIRKWVHKISPSVIQGTSENTRGWFNIHDLGRLMWLDKNEIVSVSSCVVSKKPKNGLSEGEGFILLFTETWDEWKPLSLFSSSSFFSKSHKIISSEALLYRLRVT